MKKLAVGAIGISLALSACTTLVDEQGRSAPIVIQPTTPEVVYQPAPVVIQSPTPIIIGVPHPKKTEQSVHVCTLQPFIDTFRSENVNRGQAMLDVQKQCLAKNGEMFCKKEEIQCTEYK